MTPQIMAETTDSLSARMTVAQRKEANALRKTLKPLMEKRRRARINESLRTLKALIVPLVGKNISRYSKLEKADVLEMTVRFLSELPSTSVKGHAERFSEGYKACLQSVSALLPKTGLSSETCQRVNKFIQQSMVSAAPACQTCSAKSFGMFPPIHQQLFSLKCNISQIQNDSSSVAQQPGRPQPSPRADSQHMWRPW
ncbi:transcription factor HES-2.1 [Brachyhypopomus gauderio]|uniref:transcription factor HES-2.1 n=1 Tax=Brachyhypopomus gauderio TaxID=698409 RepID=UPI0040433067